MCEDLLEDKNPKITEYNIEKLYELKQTNIIAILENNTEISYCKCKNKLLLRAKYNNLEYKIGIASTISTTVNNNGVNFND